MWSEPGSPAHLAGERRARFLRHLPGLFLAIQLLSGGGAGFSVDTAVGGGSPAFDPQPGGIPADQDPDRDLKDFSS